MPAGGGNNPSPAGPLSSNGGYKVLGARVMALSDDSRDHHILGGNICSPF